jgi:hypothetical protein
VGAVRPTLIETFRELLGNLIVRKAGADEREDLPFPSGEPIEC